MLYGDENDIYMKFKLYDSSDDKIYDLEETILYYPNMRLNNIIEPFEMNKVNNIIFRLDSPYPNPFNPITTISYNVPEDTNLLQINIYDITGRMVKELELSGKSLNCQINN